MTMTDTKTDFRLLAAQLEALTGSEPDALANTANFVGLLFNALPDINWLGVYVLRGDALVLGPFQGNPACVRIAIGDGVCGTAASERKTLRVADVHQFAGHIACDPASRSELVVPLIAGGTLLGVLDIDSPSPGRFSADDQAGVEALCEDFARVLMRDGPPAAPFI